MNGWDPAHTLTENLRVLQSKGSTPETWQVPQRGWSKKKNQPKPKTNHPKTPHKIQN